MCLNLGKIWIKVIRFGENKNLASSKHAVFYGYGYSSMIKILIKGTIAILLS